MSRRSDKPGEARRRSDRRASRAKRGAAEIGRVRCRVALLGIAIAFPLRRRCSDFDHFASSDPLERKPCCAYERKEIIKPVAASGQDDDAEAQCRQILLISNTLIAGQKDVHVAGNRPDEFTVLGTCPRRIID